MPKVSVVLSSYNHEAYIAEAVQSVLDQTYRDFELIIYDDGSSDRSAEILQSFNDKRIRLYAFSENRGPLAVSEEIQTLVQGEYVAVHHSDDVWEPDKLEKQVYILENYPACAACFTWVQFIDEKSQPYDIADGHVNKSIFDQPNRKSEEWLRYFFFHKNALCHPSVLIRKEMYHKCRLLEVDGIYQIPDFLMWVRLCSQYDIYVYQERLTKFRLRRGVQQNTSADKPEVHIRSQFEMYQLLQEYCKIDGSKLQAVFPEISKYKTPEGNFLPAYVLAKIAQSIDEQAYKLFSLQLLYHALNNAVDRKKLEKWHGYTNKDFYRDTAKYDVFGFSHTLYYLNAAIYMDTGKGFSEKDVQKEKIYVRGDGGFRTEFDLICEQPEILQLRFDPDDGKAIALHLDEVCINGKTIGWEALNCEKTEGDEQLFFSLDPQYKIFYNGASGAHLIISGRIDLQMNIWEKLLFEKDKLQKEKECIYNELLFIKNSRFFKLWLQYRKVREKICSWIK